MKPFFGLFLFINIISVSLSRSYATDDFDRDVVVTPHMSRRPLTPAELAEQRGLFVDFITRYRANQFFGRTQYTLSPINLSIRAEVRYQHELDGRISFQLATDGNRWVSHGDVTFPMVGSVYFELKRNQEFVRFQTELGEDIIFMGLPNQFYVVEDVKSFEIRKNIQSKYVKEPQLLGRFFATVKYDLYTQEISFYELVGNTLYRKGSFLSERKR